MTSGLQFTSLRSVNCLLIEGASVNGKPPVSKTGTAGSIPVAPAKNFYKVKIFGPERSEGPQYAMKKFLQEVKAELKKVSWPRKRELFDSTVAVIVATLLLGIFIGIVDFFFSQMIGIFMR